MTPTLVVTASGSDGQEIARLVQLHVAFDPERRRVIHAAVDRESDTAIVIIDRTGRICGSLDRLQALVEAWIEDAFLRAQSPA